jgi:colanic acid/amylovoran biosynthesis glycosyltransferase
LFPALTNHAQIMRRIHVNWPHVPRWKEILFFPFVFLYCLLINPKAVVRYLTAGHKQWGWRSLNNLYLDARFLLLKPSAIHFEFADLAKDRMHLKELLGCRILCSFRGHELNFVGLEEPDYYKEIWEESDGTIFVSRDLLFRAQNRGFPKDHPHWIIFGSVDTEYFDAGSREISTAGTVERPFRILSIGRLSWSKGYEYGLQAIRLLVDKGIHCEYRICGDGIHREALAFAIQDFGLQESVKLLSWQSPAELKEHFQWADVFLHSSVSEGFGIVVLEAQAMQLPVVCTDADGLRENVDDGKTGFVVPRRSSEALAEKLFSLSQSPDLRKRMGEAGRIRAMKQFPVEKEISGYSRLLCEILQIQDISKKSMSLPIQQISPEHDSV